ncbi:DNA-directed RNA polymerase III subunit RPC7-like isoform X1 [Octopus sinensis]|uniref:DNA-directed RNA polymerase III subunit n=1 Tax=Octopus sinensis TaxID=2607531 RepID=A0A7E6FMQ0_9MOLL|nr:DNA-directed RNA polymerase III subunit RPC7-like isoform X1 [Octopus sinensis]
MAGRGRGRGGASFNIGILGFNRGDALPQPIHQPPPLFPPLELKAVPLLQGEEYDYMLALKQEFRGTIRESPFYLKVTEKKKDIHRYSDKYQNSGNDGNSCFQPGLIDWDRLPPELKTLKKKLKKVRFTPKPNVPTKAEAAEVLKTLESLEKKDVNPDENETEENEGEENELEEYYEEEEEEEDNDYNLNYFDNGEDYGDDDDDDVDEGPTY